VLEIDIIPENAALLRGQLRSTTTTSSDNAHVSMWRLSCRLEQY
jgi:hypothetical protein